MPTAALIVFRDIMQSIGEIGFDTVKTRQAESGGRVREALAARGFRSAAAEGFHPPGGAIRHTGIEAPSSRRAFAIEGLLQIAAGAPLQIGGLEGFRTFRIELFGLDELVDIDGTVRRFENALDRVMKNEGIREPMLETASAR